MLDFEGMRSAADGSRTALVVGLLVVSLATTALLAWQAQRAASSHRAAAEAVLRDYASLAAEELVRRGASKLGYDGYYPLVTALARRLEVNPELDEAARELAASDDERSKRAVPLVRDYFTRARSGEIVFSHGGPESPGVRAWLDGVLETPREDDAPYHTVHGVVSGEPVTAVLREWSDASGRRRLAGFEVDLDVIGSFFRAAFEDKPLLPTSLGRGAVTNDVLFATVLDHGGVERFRSEGNDFPELGVEAPFGDTYEGILEGSRVRLSLHPGAAPDLVIGGLPPSRLPMLLGLVILTAGLLGAAILQLRRERQLQRLRTEFVASVSHELRTPLTQIRMFAETLLLGRVRSEEEATRSLRIIDREVRRLTHLVENVLQFSRVERDRLELGPETTELEPRVRETLELFQPLVAGTGVRIVPRFEPAVAAAVDSDALRQVLLNLLDNAVKYGPSEQEIVVGIESRNGAARVFVEDEGPGIPAPEREHVFGRFYRLERERSSAVAGTGIGLSVVRELVSRQGGRALVESGARGGARFVIELPAARESGTGPR